METAENIAPPLKLRRNIKEETAISKRSQPKKLRSLADDVGSGFIGLTLTIQTTRFNAGGI